MADPTSVNSQITDAVSQLNATVPSLATAFGAATAYQVVSHAIALRFHNLVAQQQHDHILRHALTTAAAHALLEGKREEAEAVIKLADSRLPIPDLTTEIAQLKTALRELQEEFTKIIPPTPPAATATPPPPGNPEKPSRSRRRKKK